MSTGKAITANIARWNGSSWNAMGTGADGEVLAIGISGSDVYVGGGFTSVGGVSNTGSYRPLEWK